MPRVQSAANGLAHLSVGERALLRRVKQVVLDVEPGAEVILYGSRARGDARSDSDWDLLVLLDGPVDRPRMEAVRDRVYDAALELAGCPTVSTLVRGREDWNGPLLGGMPLHRAVERDGIAL